jgi:hypothetical protein
MAKVIEILKGYLQTSGKGFTLVGNGERWLQGGDKDNDKRRQRF